MAPVAREGISTDAYVPAFYVPARRQMPYELYTRRVVFVANVVLPPLDNAGVVVVVAAATTAVGAAAAILCT